MLKFNKKTGMFEEDKTGQLRFNKKSGLFEDSDKTNSSHSNDKFEFKDLLAYSAALIAYIVVGFILAIIFDWMDGGDKNTDFNIIFALCFGVFMLWTTRMDI